MVTWDEGQPDGVVIEGVRVLKTCRRDEGVRGIRFITPRWTALNAALRRADAEIYYQNCGEYVTGQVALWARNHGRRFVYSVASDADCIPDLPLMQSVRERILYRYGLRNADRVIVQTHSQMRMLRAGFGLESQFIPMPCPGPDVDDYIPPRPPDGGRGRVLWIGRIERVKRPDRLLEVAMRCPELEFDLVGPASESPYARKVLEQASRIPNVRVHGPVSRDAIPAFYRSAACLCSTSEMEGFPNTFLEAWSYGVPVVSTVDPDSLISERGLGAAAATVPDIAAAIRRLLSCATDWTQASVRARSYFLAVHYLPRAMPRFEQLFSDLLAEPSGRSGCRGQRSI